MTRKALLVAIDDYGHPANNLNSCIADSTQFEQLLQSSYGFTTIQSLRDGQATLANVQTGLNWLFANATPQDRLVFHYSGHGYQTPRNGRLEEVLVLSDGFLFDDMLSQLTQPLPRGVLTTILDSCFSGGMEKILLLTDQGIEVGRPKRWTPLDPQLIEQEKAYFAQAPTIAFKPFAGRPTTSVTELAKEFRPVDLSTPVQQAVAQQKALKGYSPAAASDEVGQVEMNGLLLAACLENETASAKTSKTNGLSAFTYGLMESLRTLGNTATSLDLMTNTQTLLHNIGFRQTAVYKVATGQSGLEQRRFLLLDTPSGSAQPSSSPTPGMNEDWLRQFIQDALRKEHTMTTAPATAPVNAPVADEKFWGIVASVVGQLAPIVIRELTKEYQPGTDQKFWPRFPWTSPPFVPPALPSSLLNLFKEYPGATTAPGADAQAEEKFWGELSGLITRCFPMVIRELTKEYQPGMASNGGAQPNAQGDEKFWGIVASVVGQLAPIVIRELTKEYQPGMAAKSGTQPDVQGDEKFWGIVASVVGQLAPIVIRELTKVYEPAKSAPVFDGGAQPNVQGDDKFWGIVASIAGSVLPSLIRELTKEYQPGITAPVTNGVAPAGDPTDEKFWREFGEILSQTIPVVIRELTKEYHTPASFVNRAGVTVHPQPTPVMGGVN